jgi:hypothetical protein
MSPRRERAEKGPATGSARFVEALSIRRIQAQGPAEYPFTIPATLLEAIASFFRPQSGGGHQACPILDPPSHSGLVKALKAETFHNLASIIENPGGLQSLRPRILRPLSLRRGNWRFWPPCTCW